MSSPSQEAATTRLPSPLRWLRFSLRTMLIATTLVCVGIVAKQKYDWYWRQQLIHPWIAPLVELALAADGDVTRYPDDTLQLTPPAGLPAEEQIPLLRWGILELETPEERLAALKILVESQREESLPIVRKLVPQCRHDELQATLLHLLSLVRDPADLPLFETLLDSRSPVVRGAAAESIGFHRQPTYVIGSSLSRRSQCRFNTIPPIEMAFLPSANRFLPRGVFASGSPAAPREVPAGLRERLEAIMLSGTTADERTAAARALVEWPPSHYRLRVAEWGVWIDEGKDQLTTKGVLAEIPDFVHTTGNALATLPRNRFDGIIIITKPIIHLTSSAPLAVDLEVSFQHGRPWYAFPRPDTLTVHGTNLQADLDLTDSTWQELEPGKLPQLKNLSEGYPWIHPSDRSSGEQEAKYAGWDSLTCVGMRWQSLIVSPERQSWMSPPGVADDPKFRWWEKLREVPSAWLTSQGETERFLYYDGPTTARSPVVAALGDSKLTISHQELFKVTEEQQRVLDGNFAPLPHDSFFIDARTEATRAIALPRFRAGVIDFAEVSWILDNDVERAFFELLLEHGLTKEEAAGLLDSWRERFFQSPGQRLLTLLTPAEYDRMCPLKVRPPATETVRVGIVLREF